MNRDVEGPDTSIIRAFAAIVFPDVIHHFLRDLQGELKNTVNMSASWPEPSAMHLTLAFLGDIPVSMVPDIQVCMVQSITGYQQALFGSRSHSGPDDRRVSLSLGGVGFFPSVKNNRVLWTGVRGHTDRLELLYSILVKQLAQAGVRTDQRRFKPHVTLARIKKPVPADQAVSVIQHFGNRISDNFIVDSITLFKSRLTASGAMHTPLGSIRV
jgi:RNA 2',3'-cyclic 3'-phosphodiesterase